jgi:DNA-binding NtrC family response regulator
MLYDMKTHSKGELGMKEILNMGKILLVDDEPSVLEALQRQFRKQFCLHTASGGEEGLSMVRVKGPYAVVVSDCRMPLLDGIQLLGLIRKIAPNTVRMMLTGNNDLHTAMEAVNKGEIFRFLTKPCEPETFSKALEDGIKQYQLNLSSKTVGKWG